MNDCRWQGTELFDEEYRWWKYTHRRSSDFNRQTEFESSATGVLRKYFVVSASLSLSFLSFSCLIVKWILVRFSLLMSHSTRRVERYLYDLCFFTTLVLPQVDYILPSSIYSYRIEFTRYLQNLDIDTYILIVVAFCTSILFVSYDLNMFCFTFVVVTIAFIRQFIFSFFIESVGLLHNLASDFWVLIL